MEMLKAMERVLQVAEKQGIGKIRIDDMIQRSEAVKRESRGQKSMAAAPKETSKQKASLSFGKRIVVSLWLLWERLFHFVFQLRTTNKEEPIFHFRIRPYRGEPVMMNGD